MPSLTHARFLEEHCGDMALAYEHLCRAYDHVCAHVSIGMMRAGQPTARSPKPVLKAIDVSDQESPHG